MKRSKVGQFIVFLLYYGPTVATVGYAAYVALQLNDSVVSIQQMLSWTLVLLLLLASTQLLDRFGVLRTLEQTIARIERGISPVSAADHLFKQRLPDFEPLLRTSHTIDLCGIVLIRFVLENMGTLEERIRNGARVRFMIVDPDSPAAEQVMARFSNLQGVDELKRQATTVLGTLKPIATDPVLSKRTQIRLLPFVPAYTIRLFDAATDNAELWTEVISFRDVVDVAYHLDKRDGYWFDYIRRQFDLMWDAASPYAYYSPIDQVDLENGLHS